MRPPTTLVTKSVVETYQLHAKAWANWWQQAKKAVVTMAILMSVVLLYQAWTSYMSSSAVWLLPSFMSSSPWSAMKAQPQRPDVVAEKVPRVEVESTIGAIPQNGGPHNAESPATKPLEEEKVLQYVQPPSVIPKNVTDLVISQAQEDTPVKASMSDSASVDLPAMAPSPQMATPSLRQHNATKPLEEEKVLQYVQPPSVIPKNVTDLVMSQAQQDTPVKTSMLGSVSVDSPALAPSPQTVAPSLSLPLDARAADGLLSPHQAPIARPDPEHKELSPHQAPPDPEHKVNGSFTLVNLNSPAQEVAQEKNQMPDTNQTDMANSNSSTLAPVIAQVSSHDSSLTNEAGFKGSKWPLSDLEVELCSIKNAIANEPPLNTTADSDQLYGPIYHNVSQFKKSYELMERMFKVYVYKEGKEPLVHTGPIVGIYASEGLFIREMEGNKQFVVEDAQKAHAFFLPYSVANMVTKLYVPNSHTMLPLATFIKEYVELIAAKHPFWNRTKGGDHFYVSCHDWGRATARDHGELWNNTMEVVCNADTTDGFIPGRDSSLPEFYMHSQRLPSDPDGMGGGPGPDKRKGTLAFFAGQMHGRVRPQLLAHWEYPKGGPEMQIFGVLPRNEARRRPYDERMKSSRYCICAAGYEVNSPRIVEAIENGCVPVIIADGFLLPFSHVLDWPAFSVILPEASIPSLKSILLAIPDRRYRSMQRRLRHVRRHFSWHVPPQPFDTFHMILHSVWTTRLLQLPPSPPSP